MMRHMQRTLVALFAIINAVVERASRALAAPE